MKKLIAVVLLVVIASPAFGEVFVDTGKAAYMGGTLGTVKNETMGTLDTTQEKVLAFSYEGGKVSIPYDRIESWKYDEVLARHLGVIATTVVVLLKHRQRRHLFQIQFKDDAGVTQSAVFEVAKEQPRVIVAVLQARVKSCQVSANWPDGPFEDARATCNVARGPRTNVIPSTVANGKTTARERVTETAQK